MPKTIKTVVIGEAIIDEGSFVFIRYKNGSINMPLNLLPEITQKQIKNGEEIRVKATFEGTVDAITEVK